MNEEVHSVIESKDAWILQALPQVNQECGFHVMKTSECNHSVL